MAEEEKPKEEKEISIDLSKILKKKYLVYIILLIILLVSAYVRFLPADSFWDDSQLSAMDPYWHYRHAENVLDHGYVGDEIRIVDGKEVAWDTFHNAPEGSQASQEFYPYFSAYSYKYFGRLFAPSLLIWHRYTPAIFGVLAVLAMFLLGKQLFGEKAGLAASFMYSFSAPFMSRSITGFGDTDAPIAFFTILTMFLFVRAWDRQSFIYAIFAGISMGFFGWTWGGYSFVPMLLLATGLFFGLYVLARGYTKGKNFKEMINEHWKKYAVLLLTIVIGLICVGLFTQNPSSALFWKGSLGFTEIKSTVGMGEGGEVRNVMLTVSEMNPPSTQQLISRIHITSIILALTFFLLLPYGLWKKLKGKMSHLILFSIWLIATLYASRMAVRFIEMLLIPLSIFVGIVIAELLSRIDLKKAWVSLLIAAFLIGTIFIVPNIPAAEGASLQPSYVQTGYQTAKSGGPSLGQNWLDLFEWMRTETNPGDIMASWWDPGHAVTAIGERPVVADGSQNPFHVHDLAIIFTTTDEDEALKLLDKHNVTYFFVSNDLISKYGAISFLGTGSGQNYPQIGLTDVKQVQNGTSLIYGVNQDTSITLTMNDDGSVNSAVLRQGYVTKQIRSVFYFANNTGTIWTSTDNSSLDVLLYVQSDYKTAIYMPPEIANNMLTQLYFFNGAYLDTFELVKNFNNEIKVYKVRY